MTTNLIKILIVDDHKLFREGLSAILVTTPDINVVGEAGTGPQQAAGIRLLAQCGQRWSC